MMKFRNVLSAVIALAFAGAVSPADAAYHAPANVCAPKTAAEASKLTFLSGGVVNDAASQASVVCAAGATNINAPTSVTVFLVDNHPAIAGACRLSVVDHISGAELWGSTKVSPNGTTAISWTVPSQGGTRLMNVDCALPPVNAGSKSVLLSILSG